MGSETYYVPSILLVLPTLWSTAKIFAKRKSEIFGFMSRSNKILLSLRSQCIILGWESSWRYKSPQAIPLMILKRLDQSNRPHFAGSILASKQIMILEEGIW